MIDPGVLDMLLGATKVANFLVEKGGLSDLLRRFFEKNVRSTKKRFFPLTDKINPLNYKI